MGHSASASTRALIPYELSNYMIIRGRLRSRARRAQRLIKYDNPPIFAPKRDPSILPRRGPVPFTRPFRDKARRTMDIWKYDLAKE